MQRPIPRIAGKVKRGVGGPPYLQSAVKVVQLALTVHLTSYSRAIRALPGARDRRQPIFQLHPASHIADSIDNSVTMLH